MRDYALENEFRGQLNHARVAGKYLVPLSEQGISRSEIVRLANVAGENHVIQPARRVLRMIQRVVKIGSKLHVVALARREGLGHVQVEIIDGAGRQNVPAGGRKSACLSPDELRIRINRQVRDHLTGAVLQFGYVAAG